jgi:UDP-N-acetylglucosamine 2-epimerase (non-hydrolysing)/GDP/UDP-N,N'-diacetylbacillosamine 2-epimerase (hydrolysing)
MKKKKITVTTGTRADYGLIRPVLNEISKSKKLELYLIVTGMHLSRKHGMTINEIKKDGFKINTTFDIIPKGNSTYYMAKALGEGIVKFSKTFQKIHPDINLVLGDRDEMLASAIAAYHMNIPNAHIHGGDKSGGIDEYNRHAITKMSNIHFAPSRKSKERIIKMGENPKYVIFTGSPSIDEVAYSKITGKSKLEKIYKIKFTGQEIILLQHPVTTQSEQSELQILNTLRAIVKVKRPTIAIAPNSDAGNKPIFKHLKIFSRRYDFIKLYRTVPRSDYLGMLKYGGLLVGNSSSGLIEGSYFNIPVVNIGIRQKYREHGKNVMNVNGTTNSIYDAIMKAIKRKKLTNEFIYGDGTSSRKIVKYMERINLGTDLIQKHLYY